MRLIQGDCIEKMKELEENSHYFEIASRRIEAVKEVGLI